MKRFLFILFASLAMATTGLTQQAAASTFDSLYKDARTYLGVPYKYGGASRSGIDCSAFTQIVFKGNGTSIPRTTGQQYNVGQAVAKSNLQQGDLVFFNTSGRGVSHVGIYVGSNNFIHASTSQGVMVSSINDPYYWGSRYVGAKRVKDFSAPKPAAPKPVAKPKPVVYPHPTRIEIAVTLANELGLTASEEVSVFKDIPNSHPNISSVAAVAEAGIFTGSDGAFMPNGKLTRAQLAKILVESFNLEGSTSVSFSDVSNNHWAKEYVEILYHNGVTTGYANGKFGVNDYVTEGQFKTFIERLK